LRPSCSVFTEDSFKSQYRVTVDGIETKRGEG
jgi:hypothetical protein